MEGRGERKGERDGGIEAWSKRTEEEGGGGGGGGGRGREKEREK